MFGLNYMTIHKYLVKNTFIYYFFFFFFFFLIFCLVANSKLAISKSKENRVSINGSGLKIPRMVSLKNSFTYMRSGPGKEFPIQFELNQKGYPLKIIAEFNNWRKVKTYNNFTGWIHTQLLSSFRTGLITRKTLLKTIPSNSGNSVAKLLPNLLINIKNCKEKWCKIEVITNKVFVGWVKKETIWGSIEN